ncbi:MAG: HEPN domain-containing protein, partial [Fimbriimonadales bacterium]
MMSEEAKENYIRYRLERAHESLEAAKVLAAANLFPEAVSRLYYAAFYAVNALLLQHDLSSRKHTGVQALFNKHFVKTGLVSVSHG